MIAVFGDRRSVTLARELSKLHESVLRTTLGELARHIADNPWLSRGEAVLIVKGFEGSTATDHTESRRIVDILLAELPLARAVAAAAAITGKPRNQLYKMALELNIERDKQQQ